ncbi:MAG: hypothetical protein IKL22_01165 [Lachnospiraceae bacterium]|nr:hypothetical protein [Lachnospiraceae bacterium]
MIYVVKCYSCEQEFQVKRGETGADMICPECGTANNIRDVIERIEEKKEVDTELEAIKRFDMSMHPVVDDYWERENRRREQQFWGKVIGSAVLLVALLILRILNLFGVVNF